MLGNGRDGEGGGRKRGGLQNKWVQGCCSSLLPVPEESQPKPVSRPGRTRRTARKTPTPQRNAQAQQSTPTKVRPFASIELFLLAFWKADTTFIEISQSDQLNRPPRKMSPTTPLVRRRLDPQARSSRLKKVFLPLLLALKLKMSVVLPILLTIIKLISLKGLIAGLLALKFSIFTFLKDLFNKKQERVTTAYITSAQPVNAEIVHQDWHRNGQASPQELAYGAYNPYATLQ
ncbi:hypothetical protein RP20_CCG000697 [Aedes albopictus]|nr:hypothetical protein RP20_CCG000697 [Aedes albopictus]